MGKATARSLSTLPPSLSGFTARDMPDQANPLKLRGLCEPHPIIHAGRGHGCKRAACLSHPSATRMPAPVPAPPPCLCGRWAHSARHPQAAPCVHRPRHRSAYPTAATAAHSGYRPQTRRLYLLRCVRAAGRRLESIR